LVAAQVQLPAAATTKEVAQALDLKEL